MEGYQGILFPERAEDLRKQNFKHYKVFLEYWDSLSEKLRLRYEQVAISRRTTAMIIHDPQGSGKTLLAEQLNQGLERAKSGEGRDGDDSNLWHRLTGGSTINLQLIREATRSTHLYYIESNPKWADGCREFLDKLGPTEHCIVIADNAETGYLLQGLLNLDDQAFIQLGRIDEAYSIAAERFVALARTKLRSTLFIFLTNNEDFALKFASKVNSLHADLIELEALPMPSDRDKDTAVRVNTNLLNRVTYWYCLDRAGPEGKQTVRRAIRGSETFPGSFAAVNSALATADRSGRPANKCVLSLVVFTDADLLPASPFAVFDKLKKKRCWDSAHARVEMFDGKWAAPLVPDDRRARLLESEWNLRIITFGNRVLASLLDPIWRVKFKLLFDRFNIIHGVGTRDDTLEDYWEAILPCIFQCPSGWDKGVLQAFWSKGQNRSADYEAALSSIYPNYNRTYSGFLSYRPDLIVEPYTPCSVLDAVDDSPDALNSAIRRTAHVFEFTATKSYTADAIIKYLSLKIGNYIDILEGQ